MSKKKENNETKLEYEMKQHLLFPEEIAPKLEECFCKLRLDDSARDSFFTDNKEENKISDDCYIDTIGKILQYNIRTTQYNLGFQDIYIRRMCDRLNHVNLSNEQKEKIKDIRETYYKYFIVLISDFNELYERQKIADELDKISNLNES